MWASPLYALPSCNEPLHVVQETTIELTKDIMIPQKGSPFIATETFGSRKPEKVIITSKTNRALIIRDQAVWDLRSFSTKNKIIEFRGNARLICKNGSKILGNNGVLRFTDSSQWIIG